MNTNNVCNQDYLLNTMIDNNNNYNGYYDEMLIYIYSIELYRE